MNFGSIFEATARAAEESAKSRMRDDDYEFDGMIYCGNCQTPKQCWVKDPLGRNRLMPCLCKCGEEKRDEEERELLRQKKLERIARMRVNGIHDENIRTWTFENADDANPKLIGKARTYCDKWEDMHSENIGLLFFGNVGTGKTYLAACIANELISRGIPVLMSNFSKLLNDLSGFKETDKNAYIASLNNYELLIIDDLGVERQSDYALEQVFNIIDSRYKNGQPLIVTTNLSVEDLKNPKDMKFKRIYDRILEMTIPIKVDGVSRREQLHKEKLELAKALFAD